MTSQNNFGSLTKNKLFWILHFGGWLGIMFLTFIYNQSELSSWFFFYVIYTYYILGIIVTIVLRRFYRSRLKRILSIPRLILIILYSALVSSLVVYILHSLLCLPLYFQSDQTLFQQAPGLKIFFVRTLLSANMLFIFLVICGWSALYFGLNFWHHLKQEQVRSNKATMLAQKAQLQMLRYQLNPHFLFNSLNSISALADEDPKQTKKMITDLSGFLRYSLISNDRSFNPLSDELEAMKNYLSIEKRRFQKNLNVEFNIDPETSDYSVISFMIQPFVENAIKFGMKSSKMPLLIRICSEKTEGGIKISIYNTGHWIKPATNSQSDDNFSGTGIGVSNTIKRLQLAFPDRYNFFIEKESSFVRVNIKIFDSNYERS